MGGRAGEVGAAGPFGRAQPAGPHAPGDETGVSAPAAASSAPPVGPAAAHRPTATALDAVGRSLPWWLALLAVASVAAVAAAATTAVWLSSRSETAGRAAPAVTAVALAGLALGGWKVVQILRVRRLSAAHPWRGRTGQYGVARVRGRHQTLRHISVVVIDQDGDEPEATCPLATLHWAAGPPAVGPVALWVAGDPTSRAVVSLPGGADVLLATGTRLAFRTSFFRRQLGRGD